MRSSKPLVEALEMNIPEFPDSREITLGDKPIFDEIIAAEEPEVSAYTFTNLFAWRNAHGYAVSRVGGSVIVSYKVDGGTICLEPLGGDAKLAVEEVVRRAGGDVEFERVSARVAELVRGDPRYATEEDRDNFDYLYLTDDLINLAGRRFDAKRNFIARIRSEQNYEYAEMTRDTAEECREFADFWCEEKSCETVEGLREELCALHEMLVNFEALRLRGGAIRMDGAVVAFSLGEALNPETLVIHAEKADSRITGLYQLINNEFCIHEARRFKYVNREQDMGLPGLRKAKESYNPVRLVKTYRVRIGSKSS